MYQIFQRILTSYNLENNRTKTVMWVFVADLFFTCYIWLKRICMKYLTTTSKIYSKLLKSKNYSTSHKYTLSLLPFTSSTKKYIIYIYYIFSHLNNITKLFPSDSSSSCTPLYIVATLQQLLDNNSNPLCFIPS